MEIYRLHTRLFMIIETTDDFTFENKQKIDGESKIVQEWENMLWKYQQAIAGSAKGEKWI